MCYNKSLSSKHYILRDSSDWFLTKLELLGLRNTENGDPTMLAQYIIMHIAMVALGLAILAVVNLLISCLWTALAVTFIVVSVREKFNTMTRS